ncbi:voltage-gated sodium channel [Microbacteriaceae bacterium SG_E_30_P1]|uniref:Voltage-gated sodium channel n=1 Tax=Antiquaquibacter oligotrophicus TaxID=2880260 RepID=A0ABT6KRF3_9MICO|nr:ion transporter [Antiquaquibacter oligotrophicus]MDH6182557.1 voltage-gated sodium channel [Antiquaquibacter oligotrophicus]UDF14476.1 ion transporter [Antiquaquibacter oligotrophicus]
MTTDQSRATARPGLFSDTEVTLPAYRIRWLARIMYGDPFEIVVIAVILANAVSLAILTFDDVNPTVVSIARAVDFFAIIFYSVELVLRIVSYGRKPWMFFRNPWNVFDFLVVILIPFLNNSTVIFRLVRLLRILRIFRFLPEARILMISMVKSVAPLANLAVLIGFLMFIYAMAGVYLFGAADPERWGNVGAAFLTLTVMLTLENFPDAFLSGLEVTPFALLYFLTYMFFIVFTVLNVLIGIVINAMDQAREEVAKNSAPGGEAAISPHEEELQALRTRLAEVEAGYKVSPDHLRRIREELDRLASS